MMGVKNINKYVLLDKPALLGSHTDALNQKLAVKAAFSVNVSSLGRNRCVSQDGCRRVVSPFKTLVSCWHCGQLTRLPRKTHVLASTLGHPSTQQA